jgi:hypothetical protein
MSAGLAHLFGDYVVQNDHMARNKVRTAEAPGGALSAAAHAATYTAFYLPLTRDVRALAVIGGTHYVIDRYRLAKRLVWARNQIAPAASRYPWSEANAFGAPSAVTVRENPEDLYGLFVNTGRTEPPDWLAGWLLFIADNACHLAINEWALRRWAR